MKYGLLILLWTLISSVAWGNTNFDGNWKLFRKENNVQVWELKNLPNVFGTIQTNLKRKPINWQQIQSVDFFKQLTKYKRHILSFLNISDWKISYRHWKRRKDHYELGLKGSYVDYLGRAIVFIEHHLYFPNKTHQFLVTYPINSRPKANIINGFISSAKSMVK